MFEDFKPSLPAIAPPAKGARLRLCPGVGGGAEHGHEIAKALLDLTAVGREVERIHGRIPQRGFPIDDAVVGFEAGALAPQQVDLLRQWDMLPGLALRTGIFSVGRRGNDLRKIHHALARTQAGPSRAPARRRGAAH